MPVAPFLVAVRGDCGDGNEAKSWIFGAEEGAVCETTGTGRDVTRGDGREGGAGVAMGSGANFP
jgi:hypothetical protein